MFLNWIPSRVNSRIDIWNWSYKVNSRENRKSNILMDLRLKLNLNIWIPVGIKLQSKLISLRPRLISCIPLDLHRFWYKRCTLIRMSFKFTNWSCKLRLTFKILREVSVTLWGRNSRTSLFLQLSLFFLINCSQLFDLRNS